MIKIIKISKCYSKGLNKFFALKNVSLDIPDNKFTIITGPSGSGKTTLLNLIGCIDEPSSGKIIIGKDDISKFSENELADYRNLHIGYIFQRFFLDEHMPVIDNIAMPLTIRGVDKVQRNQEALDCLIKVGLEDKKESKVMNLSGGEKQRVAIARALISGANLILADEPTANLDSDTGEQIVKLIKDSVTKLGKTVVMTTHSLSLLKYADNIIKIKDGEVVNNA